MATAVERADGWFPAMVPRAALTSLAVGLDAGRRARCQLISGPITAITSDGHDGRRTAKQLLGWYLTGMGPFYGLRHWDEASDIVAVTTGPVPSAALHDLIDASVPRPAGSDHPALISGAATTP